MDGMPPPELDRLLADTSFVRRIARALVRDPDVADDVAQDALVIALERPPREGTSLRGWIATVVRTLAVDRARNADARRRRESNLPEREPVPRPDEIVARLDLSRHVGDALRELEEPYRTALYLRYVEELEPPAVAARLGVPLATAKTRLRRGLELLRARFDREWGDRGAWSALFLPLAAHPTHATIGAGALVMSTTIKVAAAACVVGVAAWMLWPKVHVDTLAGTAPVPAAEAPQLSDPGRDEKARQALAAAAATNVGDGTRGTHEQGPFVRVLDERRFPVARAHVQLHLADLGDDEAVSDEHGIARFTKMQRLEDQRRTATLLAWDDHGRVAVELRAIERVDASMRADDVDATRRLQDIVLLPGSAFDVHVLAQGRPAAGAHIAVTVRSARIPLMEVQADDTGRAHFEHVPATAVLVKADLGDLAGRASTVLAPGRREALTIVLEPARTIEARVIDAETKAPIAGAVLRIGESFNYTPENQLEGPGRTLGGSQRLALAIPLTDADGRTQIRGLPAQGKYGASAKAAGYAMPLPPRGAFPISAENDTVTVELVPLHTRTVRWPLEKGEVDAPAIGTVLTLRDRADRDDYDWSSVPPEKARIEEGAVVADGVLDRMESTIAVAPDGSVARLYVGDGQTTGAPTSFRAPRKVDVHLFDPMGNAAPGILVSIDGDNGRSLLPSASSDVSGAVTFGGLWDRRVFVYAANLRLGPIDLEAGDASLDGRIQGRSRPGRAVAVRLLLDGTPGLPAVYELSARRYPRLISEDPALGILHLQLDDETDAEPVKLGVIAKGFLRASVELGDTSSNPAHVTDIELHRASSLLAHVRMPKSGRVRLRTEPWDPEKAEWVTGSVHRVDDERFAPNAPDDGFLYEGLEPGKYRVHDIDSDRASEGVDIALGKQADVQLDLSDLVRVRGVIEMPPNPSPFYAHILIEGEGLAPSEPQRMRGSEPVAGHYMLDGEGHFEVLVSSAHPTTLRAAHPYLSPDPKLGSVVVQGDAEYVHLKLIAGDEVQIPIASLGVEMQPEHLRVYAYSGDPMGEPRAWFHAIVVDGTARFSGLPRGTWTLWIECDERHAPLVVRELHVGEGITRVEQQAPRGSSLRVRIVNAGEAVPHIWVNGAHRGEPVHYRGAVSEGENPVMASGFGAGTYEVTVSIDGEKPLSQKRTIEFDGVHDVDFDFDVRALPK